MSHLRYKFIEVKEVHGKVSALFDKGIQNFFGFRSGNQVAESEKGCIELYKEATSVNPNPVTMAGKSSIPDIQQAFEAIHAKKVELGIPFDYDYLS